ncbi:Gfo/Idh/MocA family protein [Leucobacter musarum]|uniref:Gfo/Idh/MocA family protein n=1 Tax=Leucobacter musarum TaxID=1930747 RepID=UPI0006A7E36F|nr:Gfo/Idh/MocA family oxidoreductase [Leucobacter musarum]
MTDQQETPVRVGVLGACGWMGRVHSNAYQNIEAYYGKKRGTVEVAWLVDAEPNALAAQAAKFPTARTTADWREVIDDPDVDLIDICLPDSLHYEIAKAAILAGKHVYCEKPLSDSAAEARELAELAKEAGVVTRVGYSFMRNPAHDVARDIIESGEIGEITMVKASQHIDSFGDPNAPFIWRADGNLAPTGITGDTGSHVFAILDGLVGSIEYLVADSRIITPQRPIVEGAGAYGANTELTGDEPMADVTNADAVNLVCTFSNGAMGLIDFSRTATGRKFEQKYEIYGTRGSLVYNYDEINRIRVYSNDDPQGRRGFKAIDVGTENENFAAFLNLPNTGLGYNETKVIEASEVIRSVTTGESMWPDFEAGFRIAQLVEACQVSSDRRAWVDVASI